jgi:hypothetical protein
MYSQTATLPAHIPEYKMKSNPEKLALALLGYPDH